MPTWTAISKTDHQHTGWTRFTNYAHAQHDALAPVLAVELPHLLGSYALAFAHSNTTSNATPSYQLVAILSLQAGLNLFLDTNQQWQASYVPSHYRSYPFALQPNQQGEMTLCFDADSGLIHTPAEDQQTPLLDADQAPSKELTPIIDFLQQRHQHTQLTQTLVNQLAEHQLIQPWEIESAGADGEAKPVKGLYHINEAALKNLDPTPLSHLAHSGALGLAYGQLLSQARLHDLTRRFEQNQTGTTSPEVDIEALFGEKDDNLFRF
ncbi:SapC family protein [Pelovirga terrestris]|uniref:SapC family protein n=1 Tax=Pelovirga terrestris TaxID=2771352 RepID=A0A8J6URT9_9BACT|nr:SapC family protein [Pelovirga terrestris]MBD1401911.1 SapC family protein [Pelovirga terrestris]